MENLVVEKYYESRHKRRWMVITMVMMVMVIVVVVKRLRWQAPRVLLKVLVSAGACER